MALFRGERFDMSGATLNFIRLENTGASRGTVSRDAFAVDSYLSLLYGDYALNVPELPASDRWDGQFMRRQSSVVIGDLQLSDVDAFGGAELLSGTIRTATGLGWSTGTELIHMEDITLSVAELRRVIDSPSLSDNAALLRRLMQGDDVIQVDRRDNSPDRVSAGRGDDVVRTGGLSDTLRGEDGLDQLSGGSGDDFLFGGGGMDGLYGGPGNDRMQGDRGDDLLFGRDGNDTLRGGEGADRFVIGTDAGADHIRGFEDGVDRLVFIARDWISQLQIRAIDADTVLIRGSFGEVRVHGVSRDQISRADMIFGQAARTEVLRMEDAIVGANQYFDV